MWSAGRSEVTHFIVVWPHGANGGGNVRGQTLVKWRERSQEYVRERDEGSLRNLEQAMRECQDRERWKLCRGHPLVGAPIGVGVENY